MGRIFEQGRYIVTDTRSGMALDLSGADNRSLIAFGLHGWENQQWEFHPCGKGFIINSAHSSNLFLMLRDLKGLHLEGSAQVVTGTFPTCWEVEVDAMDDSLDRSATGPADKPGDIFAHIRLPHFDGMALGFKGSHAGAPLFLAKEEHGMCTYWRLRSPARHPEQVVEAVPIATSEAVVQGDGMTRTTITTTSVTTTTRTVTQIAPGNV